MILYLAIFLQNFNPLSVRLFPKNKATIIPKKISVYAQFAEHDVKIKTEKFIKIKNTKELTLLGEPFLVYDTDFKAIRFTKEEIEPNGEYLVLFYKVEKDDFIDKEFNSLSKEGFCWILPHNNKNIRIKNFVIVDEV